jgi:hypothetical protein
MTVPPRWDLSNNCIFNLFLFFFSLPEDGGVYDRNMYEVIRCKNHFTSMSFVAINVSNQLPNLLWHIWPRKSQVHNMVLCYQTTNIPPTNKTPALDNYDNTYANSYMWPHRWGAIPSAVMPPVCSAFSTSGWAPHRSASPPSAALHKRNWPPQHSRRGNWPSQYHFHTVLNFPTEQHLGVTLSMWAHQNTTFWAPIVPNTTSYTVRHSTRPVIKPEVQWRQNSSRAWVPLK